MSTTHIYTYIHTYMQSEMEINKKISREGGIPGVADFLGTVDLSPIAKQLPPGIGSQEGMVWTAVQGKTLDQFFDRYAYIHTYVLTYMCVYICMYIYIYTHTHWIPGGYGVDCSAGGNSGSVFRQVVCPFLFGLQCYGVNVHAYVCILVFVAWCGLQSRKNL
jgi:hypothetical protein